MFDALKPGGERKHLWKVAVVCLVLFLIGMGFLLTY